MSKIVLNAPECMTDVSFGGENFAVVDGVVEVPEAALEFLFQFGFTVKPEAAGEQGEPSEPEPSEPEPSEPEPSEPEAEEPKKTRRSRAKADQPAEGA
ncbi:hypothetical protein [Bergeriella denitrificans]|uniref:Putative phage associated protein n=1 Tax=Bergeriella denitrificans TaxID=494 RepID=A0A378UJP8_BERDE|nr:hypothetical protein [Bergeriella denitrificans]STZ77350.1 putative phage associated protein [Bergeriella denitrificans]